MLLGLKNTKGKRFFVTMNDLVGKSDSGWVEYYWPVPGSKDIVRKVSYVKKCTLPDGTEVVNPGSATAIRTPWPNWL